MEHCIAESTFDRPFTGETEKKSATVIDSCLAETGGRWLRSLYSKDHTHLVCEFEADVETVAKAYAEAKLPYDRIWTAEVFERELAPHS